MKSRFNGFFDLKYQTKLSTIECFERILSDPHIFQSDFVSELVLLYAGEDAKKRNYDCYALSSTEIHLSLNGGRFTKFVKSRFVMEFIPEYDFTTVFLRFQGDLFNLPLMTPTAEIDCFIREKIQGNRVLS